MEVRETVQEILVPSYVGEAKPAANFEPLFAKVSDDELLSYGVPAEWLADVRAATEDSLLTLADHLPGEAAEALLELATGGKPRVPQPVTAKASPFDHPDAQRRFRVMSNVEELERALEFPWDKWTVFDVETGALEPFAELLLPAAVQYAWANSRRTHLYAACSDGEPPPGPVGSLHRLVALRIDPKSGALSMESRQATLPGRTVHMTLDATDRHAVVAFNNPPGVTVHALAADGTLEKESGEAQQVDCGHYPHQIRVSPSNKRVIVVSRGTRPSATSKGTPGALMVSSFANGSLKTHASIAPDGGVHFGARHLDFHPSRPWAYVGLELQNKLHMFGMEGDEFTPQPLFARDTLPAGTFITPRQVVGTVHVHPNGKYVYVVNRCNGSEPFEGRPFYSGGDNSMAVYAINQSTGEPTLIQNEDTRGLHTRTFSIDPGGRLLVAAHISGLEVRDADSIGTHFVAGGLSAFRVQDDGKLAFLRRLEVETDRHNRLWWSKLFRIGE